VEFQVYRFVGLKTQRATLKVIRSLAFLLAMAPNGAAFGTTTTTTFQSQITIAASCTILSATTLDYGTQGVLGGSVDQTSTIQVQCTNTTPYNIGLDAGVGAGATVAVRKMTNTGVTINYSLYSNAGRTTVWGDTIATDTVAATGNGASQSYTVYGRVPAQTTPAPGLYTDTVTVTVTY
jgi:spore coat protein U-like protein